MFRGLFQLSEFAPKDLPILGVCCYSLLASYVCFPCLQWLFLGRILSPSCNFLSFYIFILQFSKKTKIKEMPQAFFIHLLLLLLGAISSQCKHTKPQFTGTIGAIVDTTFKAGKQEKLAIGMAVEDFSSSTGHKPLLHVRDSEGNPVQAAWEGEFWSSLPFVFPSN